MTSAFQVVQSHLNAYLASGPQLPIDYTKVFQTLPPLQTKPLEQSQSCDLVSFIATVQNILEPSFFIPSQNGHNLAFQEGEIQQDNQQNQQQNQQNMQENNTNYDDFDPTQLQERQAYILEIQLPYSQQRFIALTRVYSQETFSLGTRVQVTGLVFYLKELMEMEDTNLDFQEDYFGKEVPRVHAMNIQVIKQEHYCQEMINALPDFDFFEEKQVLEKVFQELTGDANLANLLMFTLVQNTVHTPDGNLVGKLVINILKTQQKVFMFKGQKSHVGQVILELFSKILPHFKYVDLCIEGLEKDRFRPMKNNKINLLEPSEMQLPNHTLLVINENSMKSGTLNENALKNYKFLAHLIEYQQMLFDFEFFEQKLPMNFPCLILSEGKSLFPNDLSITLKSEYQDITYIEQLLSSEEKIKKIRNYILNLQKIYKEMAISKDCALFIENDFVTKRQNKQGQNEHDLHKWIMFAKFFSALEGNQETSVQNYQTAQALFQHL